ncbi:MAG: PQQ-binding-like beta-propeller repeat protein [Planctomycetes bacterium]|nr:PQQ-binding-like beta-propeller repeat protein [Planctomycetota bacterium]
MVKKSASVLAGCILMASWSNLAAGAGQAVSAVTAETILRDTGVRGGIAVLLGWRDGRLATALQADGKFTVQCLTRRPGDVRAARAQLLSEKLYGPVSVELLPGRALPYSDDLIDLVIVLDDLGVGGDEILRVLRPGGVACAVGAAGRKDAPSAVTVIAKKPFPADEDEWSHFLHDAGNNAVARDSRVGPPRRLRWLAGPLWLRSHETPSGVQAEVAAGGRIFYIFDEGLIGITDERFPGRWAIICRDAFNGRLLWRRPLSDWGWRAWARSRFEGKDWTKMRAARLAVPDQAERRLVADADRLYATLAYRAPLSILDAATGKVLATVEGTDGTAEILLSDGVVLAHVRSEQAPANARRGASSASDSTFVAAAAGSGKVLWRRPAGGSVADLMTAIDGGRVFYVTGRTLRCLDLKTGRPLWQTPVKGPTRRSLVAHGGVVLLLGGTALDGYDAAGGKLLWHRTVPRRSGFESYDLFVVGDVAWPGVSPVDKNLRFLNKSSSVLAVGYDIRTGEVRKRIHVVNLRSPEHHHRCYRNKATSRYIITALEGAEFLDLLDGTHCQNNWMRGACRLGVMPCYGLLYVPADQCFCEPGAKLLGFAATAPKPARPAAAVPDGERLVKGPAYDAAGPAGEDAARPDDWPTFRHDGRRHGSTTAAVAAKVKPLWRASIGGRLTAPVAAGGRLYVASIDSHSVYALDAATGRPLWHFTAGGRVDSPPTVFGRRVLFGSADGWVYCLRADDGALAWRFLAAPREQRIGAFDQLESAWPVHGSVLVRDGVAYVAAGRSTYLDGGIYFYGLDPASGKILHRGHIAGPYRRPDGPRDTSFYVPGANSDVLVSEGPYIFMRQKRLSPDLKELPAKNLSSKGEQDLGLHVFSTAGLLDDSWYNRTFWMYSKRWPGYQLANQAPKSGQLLVVDDRNTYAVKVFYRRNVHSPMFFPGRQGYLLFADRNTTEPQIVGEPGSRPPLRWLPQSDYSRGRGNQMVKLDSPAFGKDKYVGYTRATPPLWTLWLGVRIRAMVKTRDVLFVAGPPDEFDPKDPFGPFEGRCGARLVAVGGESGRKLHEMKLDTPPVFDGMIAVAGRLFVSLADGSLLCLAGAGETAR